jgi:thermitase
MYRATVSLGTTVLLLVLGCAGTYGPSPANPSDDGTVLEVQPSVFTDDQVAAMAALPSVENELLVQSFPGANPEDLADLYKLVDVQVVDALPEIELTVLRVEPDRLEAAAEELAGSGLLENLQKNYVFTASLNPDDPQYSLQAHLPQIDAPQAWNTTTGSEDVLVAIVDTGVDADHPDLAEKIVGGWNVYDDSADFSDTMGHGTAVAGVAAARSDNGIGVAGVSWDSPVLAVRASDEEGSSTGRHLAAGILYAAGQGATIINVSFAPLHENSVVKSAAVQAANRGAVVVISSGNSGQTYSAPGYDQALFVGAVGADDQLASFSDKGPYVDQVAPGSGIRSTAVDGGYRMMSGTSFSAPIVSGVAALMRSANPELSAASIRELLIGTAGDRGATGRDDSYGYGAVDAAAAVAAVLDAVEEDDTTPPTVRITRPTDGSSKNKRFIVSASVTDNEGVAEVALAVDGIPFAADSRAPYNFVLEPNHFSTGEHELHVEATDLAGNRAEGKLVTVRFTRSSSTSGDASRITFLSPAAESTVSGDRTIKASVSDANGLATVEWFIDGESAIVSPVSGTSSTVTYLWHSEDVDNGAHTITLVVTDAFGDVSRAEMTLYTR